jgi:hypothetical protein
MTQDKSFGSYDTSILVYETDSNTSALRQVFLEAICEPYLFAGAFPSFQAATFQLQSARRLGTGTVTNKLAS